MSIQKKKIEKTVFEKTSETPIKWKDVKDFEFEDDDILNGGFDEGHYSENNSWDPFYFLEVKRRVEETDEEAEERVKREQAEAEALRQRRYETYLRLHREFGDEGNDQR